MHHYYSIACSDKNFLHFFIIWQVIFLSSFLLHEHFSFMQYIHLNTKHGVSHFCYSQCLIVCYVLPPSAEREEEFTLTETTATSPSPGSYSPARSVHSVGVSSASSPTAAVSPEYTGVTASTGETGRATVTQGLTGSLHIVPVRQNICLCVYICVYQALFSHIPGPLHTQWQQQVAPLQRPDSSCPVWGAAPPSLLHHPHTGCQSTPTERSMGNYH